LSDMPSALETCDVCAAADSGHDDVHADSVEEVLQCLAVFDDDFRAICILLRWRAQAVEPRCCV
jgi:hypothetical protein